MYSSYTIVLVPWHFVSASGLRKDEETLTELHYQLELAFVALGLIGLQNQCSHPTVINQNTFQTYVWIEGANVR
jgi:hypothetical protein